MLHQPVKCQLRAHLTVAESCGLCRLNRTKLTLIGCSFQVISGPLTFFLNIYILFVIVSVRELRSLSLYPVALQAFCDILVAQQITRSTLYEISQGFSTVEEKDGEWKHHTPYPEWFNRFILDITFGNNRYASARDYFLGNELNLYSTPYPILA